MKWSQVEELFRGAMEKVGNPPVHLLRPYEIKERGVPIGSFLGKCIYIKMNRTGDCIIEDAFISVVYRNRKKTEVRYTIYHEIGHALFPKKPHWWIECYALKLAHGKCMLGIYSFRYNHSPRELPTEAELLQISIEKSQRLNALPHLSANNDTSNEEAQQKSR